MNMIEIIKNKEKCRISYYGYNVNSTHYIHIKENETISFNIINNNKDHNIEALILIDGFNVLDGTQAHKYGKKFIVKPEDDRVISSWVDNKDFMFQQTFSDYSIANNGDPKKRGTIEIEIFEKGDLTKTHKCYYNINKEARLPISFIDN